MNDDMLSVLVNSEIKLIDTIIALNNQGYIINNKKKDKINTLIILNNIFKNLIPIKRELTTSAINFYNKVITI